MGIVERKEKQKHDIKRQILDASMKLFVEEGFGNVSIRKIADLIEYSPTTVYLYFKDKDEIFFSLHEMGFTKFLEMNRSLSDIENPLVRLHKMGENYLEFGLNNPEYYDLMFIQEAPMDALEKKENGDWDHGDAALNSLKNLVSECMEKKFIRKANIESVSLAIWSLVHGLVSLAIRERLSKLVKKNQAKKTMHQSLNWFLGLMDESVKRK